MCTCNAIGFIADTCYGTLLIGISTSVPSSYIIINLTINIQMIEVDTWRLLANSYYPH